MKFDVTQAVKDWSSNAILNQGLEIWVESTDPDDFATKVARKFRFVKPGDKDTEPRPTLIIVFNNRDSWLHLGTVHKFQQGGGVADSASE